MKAAADLGRNKELLPVSRVELDKDFFNIATLAQVRVQDSELVKRLGHFPTICSYGDLTGSFRLINLAVPTAGCTN